MNQEKIGQLIKKIRKENNLTQKEFADKYGVTYQAVSKWENGKNIPDISLIKQISSDFNIDIEDILEGKIVRHKNYKPIIAMAILITIGIIISAVLLKKAAGVQKASGTPKTVKAGKITEAQLREIAEYKMPDLNANDVEAAMRIIAGTARNMGVKVEGWE